MIIEPFNDEYFMKKALIEAENASQIGEIPVGCIVVCNNQIIARAHNLTEALNDVTAHAEMQAITAAANQLGGKYLRDCEIFITLEPCVMCAGALGWSQAKKIIIGARDEKKGYLRLAPSALHPKTIVITGVLEEKSNQLLKAFFESKRKKLNSK